MTVPVRARPTRRAGVEEHLRRKWISSFDLERPSGPSGKR